jgi:hypothetical protein
MRDWLRLPRIRAMLSLLGAWLLFFGPTLLSSGVPYRRDLLHLYIPARHYLHERLRSGQLPQWYPYEALGVPFIGQIVTATFHPETWLFLPFAPAVAVKLNILFGYLLALAGAYKAGRAVGASRAGAVAGAFAFAFGGYAIGVSDNLPYVVGLATLPWVLWAAWRVCERRRWKDAALLGLLTASIFLAGDAQSFATCPLIFGLIFLTVRRSWRALGLLASAGVLALLCISVEWMPALVVAAASLRHAWVGDMAIIGQWSFHPWRILEWIIPSFTPALRTADMGVHIYGGRLGVWAETVFAGTIVCLLVAAGVRARSWARWPLVGLLALGVWLALGPRFLLFRGLCAVLPIFGSFRYPEKYLALAWLAAGPLAALGYDRIALQPQRWWKRAAVAAAVLLVAALIVSRTDPAGMLWRVAGKPLDPKEPIRELIRTSWSRGLLTSAAILGVGAVAIRSRRWLPLVGLLFVELWAGNGGHVQLAPLVDFEESNAFIDRVRANARDGVPAPRASLRQANITQVEDLQGGEDYYVRGMRLQLISCSSGLGHVQGFGTMLPGAAERYVRLFGDRSDWDSPVAPRFNSCFVVEPATNATTPGEREFVRDDPFGLKLMARQCDARATFDGTLPAADYAAAIQMRGEPLPPHKVIWEGASKLDYAAGSIHWLEYSPERVRLQVDAPAPTALVLRDQFAAGWTATIDGAPTPIIAANLAARGVELPAGQHLVEFDYRTPRLRLGASLSLLGLVLALAMWWQTKRSSR